MFAGGMTLAAPAFAPEALADERLMYVSCENEAFENTFGGPQICEIIISDPARDETDEAQSEPVVEINGDTVRLVQGTDGFWYAYVASTWAVGNATADTNLDFGTKQGMRVHDASGTADALNYGAQTIKVRNINSTASTVYTSATIIQGEQALSDYGIAGTQSTGTYSQLGQLNLSVSTWPVIQTFEWSQIQNVDVIFEKPGGVEEVNLYFDTTEDYAGIEIDRFDDSLGYAAGPVGAEVHLTITDPMLNIDPTTEEAWMFMTQTSGSEGVSYCAGSDCEAETYNAVTAAEIAFDDNGVLKITMDANSVGTNVLANDATLDDTTSDEYMHFLETAPNSGVFVNTDDADDANLIVNSSARLETTATIDYNDTPISYRAIASTGSITMHGEDAGEEWNSGEPIGITLVDPDRNLNTADDEDLTVATTDRVPTITIGSPITVTAESQTNGTTHLDATSGIATYTATVANLDDNMDGGSDRNTFSSGTTAALVNAMNTSTADRFVSWDVSSACQDSTIALAGQTGLSNKGTYNIGVAAIGSNAATDVVCQTNAGGVKVGDTFTYTIDWMAFGSEDQHGVYRVEVEETDDNTGVFTGTVEFILLNQLTIQPLNNSTGMTGISDDVTMVINADMTGTDAPRVKYNDTDADGVYTAIGDQVDAPTHSGVVTLNSDSYKIADTLEVTVNDMDLNTDSELIDVYIVQADDRIGDGDTVNNHVLDVYFNDYEFDDDCEGSGATQLATPGLTNTGMSLTETGIATGVFTGTFQIPEEVCADTVKADSTGSDIFVNYWDFRDAGGNEIEVGAAATVRANTGSVSFDRSVYPVPVDWAQWKSHDDNYMTMHNVTVTVAVTDADKDTSATGYDTIPSTCTNDAGDVACIVIKHVRGSTSTPLHVNAESSTHVDTFTLTETEEDSGVFDYEFQLNATNFRDSDGNDTYLKQGDVITAEYTDTADASGEEYLVTDSSTLDLRTGSLLSDKSVYVIGSDAIITLVDPDLNMDADSTESYSLGLVEWDSDAGIVNLNAGQTYTENHASVSGSPSTFDPEPSAFRETGSDTGIFQVVIEIPSAISSTNLDQGEMIELEYVDYAPAGEDRYGDDTEDIGLVIYTSNFGATIELDSKVYTWTDRVFVTIVAPDHNKDSSLINEIGGSGKTLTAQTRDSKLTAYKMIETGVDTGIFFGEITLSGFAHDADGDGTNDGPYNSYSTSTSPGASGPTNGLLKADESDGITVSFEYTEDSTVVSSSLIRWNIGEVSFNEDAYLSSSSAVISVVDPDMNANADSVENFKVDVYSDSDSGGIELTVTETNESTGVFEGTVFFTTSDASSGHTLRVSEGDAITTDYSDHTLPEPYSTSDDIDVSATAVIGTSTPPLERAPVANARVVDAFGNSLAEVSVDQQVQIEADLVNGQDGDQSFAYLVQVQDSDGVTVSLAWITGQLSGGQSFSPALSWIPDASGSYEATVFVWESVDNPTALSDTASVSITVV